MKLINNNAIRKLRKKILLMVLVFFFIFFPPVFLKAVRGIGNNKSIDNMISYESVAVDLNIRILLQVL